METKAKDNTWRHTQSKTLSWHNISTFPTILCDGIVTTRFLLLSGSWTKKTAITTTAASSYGDETMRLCAAVIVSPNPHPLYTHTLTHVHTPCFSSPCHYLTLLFGCCHGNSSSFPTEGKRCRERERCYDVMGRSMFGPILLFQPAKGRGYLIIHDWLGGSEHNSTASPQKSHTPWYKASRCLFLVQSEHITHCHKYHTQLEIQPQIQLQGHSLLKCW